MPDVDKSLICSSAEGERQIAPQTASQRSKLISIAVKTPEVVSLSISSFISPGPTAQLRDAVFETLSSLMVRIIVGFHFGAPGLPTERNGGSNGIFDVLLD